MIRTFLNITKTFTAGSVLNAIELGRGEEEENNQTMLL